MNESTGNLRNFCPDEIDGKNLAVRLQRLMERFAEGNGKLKVKDYSYIYGDDLVFVILDKGGRYISFEYGKYLEDESLLISNCNAEIVGMTGKTMILRLSDKTSSYFKVGTCKTLHKVVGEQQ